MATSCFKSLIKVVKLFRFSSNTPCSFALHHCCRVNIKSNYARGPRNCTKYKKKPRSWRHTWTRLTGVHTLIANFYVRIALSESVDVRKIRRSLDGDFQHSGARRRSLTSLNYHPSAQILTKPTVWSKSCHAWLPFISHPFRTFLHINERCATFLKQIQINRRTMRLLAKDYVAILNSLHFLCSIIIFYSAVTTEEFLICARLRSRQNYAKRVIISFSERVCFWNTYGMQTVLRVVFNIYPKLIKHFNFNSSLNIQLLPTLNSSINIQLFNQPICNRLYEPSLFLISS